MRAVRAIAGAELRYLLRTPLAATGLALLLLLSALASATSAIQTADEAARRAALQAAAEASFDAQPDRHPHRMVHYGHFVYRPTTALAAFEPGIDPLTGTSLFLEGHRQNTPTVSAVRESSGLARFGAATPATVLHVLAPLLLILIGHASVARERPAGLLQLTLQGARAGEIVAGKALALGVVGGLALVPAALGLVPAATSGDGLPAALLLGGAAVHLAAWTLLIVALSALAPDARTALACLLGVWVALALLVPRLAADAGSAVAALPPRVETDLAIAQAGREIGDSHNPDDPFFAAFKARTLAAHNVTRVEDLPFNWRGALSYEGERLTSELFVRFWDEVAAQMRAQARRAADAAPLSPVLAARRLSLAAAGTGLEAQLRFLAAGEAHRYALIQHLNLLHRDHVAAADDASRSRDPAAERRTRVASALWAELPDFALPPPPVAVRARAALPGLAALALWLGLAALLAGVAVRRLAQQAPSR